MYETAKKTLMYRTVLWTLRERERVGRFGRMALKHFILSCWAKIAYTGLNNHFSDFKYSRFNRYHNLLFLLNFIYCCLCLVFIATTQAFFYLGTAGVTLHCSVQASHCGGFSCCGAQAQWCMGFSSCGSWALDHRLSSCGAQAELLCM